MMMLPIQKDPRKAISALLKRLHEARDLIVAGPIEGVSNEDPIVSSFQNIDNKLEDLNDPFGGVKLWEDRLMAKFGAVERHIFNILLDARNKKSNAEDLSLKIKIEEDLSLLQKKIEELNEALRPPDKIGSESRERRPQREEDAAPKMSEDWLKLRLEDEILASPAMESIKASYDNLDSLELRLCFLCFSIFPLNAVIKRRPLIYWWISEGLIKGTRTKTAEEIGEDFFQRLLELGLIKAYHENPNKPSPVVKACRMHPWIRYMLILLAKKSDLFDFNSQGMPCYNTSMSQRACLVLGSHIYLGDTASKGNLLTIFNVSEQYLSFAPEWLPKVKKLVVLQLGRWQNSPKHHIEVENENFLNGLGKVKLLKYLSLRGISRITMLPSSILELISLEILDLKACHNLETLPSDIGSLRNLTHLNVSDCPLLEGMPKGLERLAGLQVLKGFVIGNPKRTPCRVNDLVRLTKLRRLSVYIGSEAVVEEREFSKLKELESLRTLTITWGVQSPEERQLAAMTDLSFPPRLEKLGLRGIPRESPPKELKPEALNNLKRLYIWGGKLSSLDRGGTNEWNVKILLLKYLKDFKVEKKKLLADFPHLDYLEVICDGTKEGENLKYKNEYELTKTDIENEKYKGKSKEEDISGEHAVTKGEIEEEKYDGGMTSKKGKAKAGSTSNS